MHGFMQSRCAKRFTHGDTPEAQTQLYAGTSMTLRDPTTTSTRGHAPRTLRYGVNGSRQVGLLRYSCPSGTDADYLQPHSSDKPAASTGRDHHKHHNQ